MKKKLQPQSLTTLGIEGGGTKTTWVLLNEHGEVLQKGVAAKSNVSHASDEDLLSLFQSIAKVVKGCPNRIGAGFAGCHLPAERARVKRIVQMIWSDAKKIVIGEDTQTAYAAAHGQAEGLIVICGTGSNVYGIKDGRAEKAGGWGFLFGDPGSGFDTVRRALVEVYADYDVDREVSPLGKRLLAATKKKTLDELVPFLVNDFDKAKVASFAHCVFDAASDGDEVAIDVLQEGAEELALRVVWVAARLGLKKPRIGCIGSLLEKQERYFAAFEEAVQRQVKGAELFLITTPGAVGAARMASPELCTSAAH